MVIFLFIKRFFFDKNTQILTFNYLDYYFENIFFQTSLLFYLHKKMRIINFYITIFLISLNFQFKALSSDKNKNEMHQIYDEKNYAGPMGMGLVKSFKTKGKIICHYNTVNGYEKLVLDNTQNCPKNISE